MREIRTAYTWLGIEENATQDDIKRAWREAAKKHHPDRGGDPSLFQKLQSSYECLSDPEKRIRYDAKVKKIRRQETIRSKGKSIFDGIASFWSNQVDIETQRQEAREQARREQERVNRNRDSSPHSEYFREQEKAERAWREEYERTMKGYWDEQSKSVGVERVLHSTDEILYSILSDGIVRMGKHKIEKDPVGVGIEPEIKVEGKAKEVVEDLRDSILEAERLVRIFNKFTGGV